MLGEVQRLRAIGEQRRAALPEVQPPRIHYREVRQQLRGCLALVRDQCVYGRQQLGVG